MQYRIGIMASGLGLFEIWKIKDLKFSQNVVIKLFKRTG